MAEKDIFKFTIQEDGKDIEKEFRVELPNKTAVDAGQKVYNIKFREALDSKSFLRIKLDEVAREQGLWDDDKEIQLNSLQQDILNNEKVLSKGGINIGQAKDVALKLRQLRDKIQQLVMNRASLDPKSAEAQAENAQFDSYVSSCLVYNDTDEAYFSGLDDYLQNQYDPLAILAATKLSAILYGSINDSFIRSKPENKFLKDYGFIDDELRLVNKDGHLIDEEGRLINEEGRFVNKDGGFIDRDGNPLDEDGDYAFDSKPFFDDKGNEILPVDNSKKETKNEAKSVKKKGRPSKKVETEVPEKVLS